MLARWFQFSSVGIPTSWPVTDGHQLLHSWATLSEGGRRLSCRGSSHRTAEESIQVCVRLLSTVLQKLTSVLVDVHQQTLASFTQA